VFPWTELAAHVGAPVLPIKAIGMVLETTSRDSFVQMKQVGAILATDSALDLAPMDFAVGGNLGRWNESPCLHRISKLINGIMHA